MSMSFGFASKVDAIDDAIANAIHERKKQKRDIVFFAAANNDGRNSKELFPASMKTVLSVRGTDHMGAFVQNFNPEPWSEKKGSVLYGTLGQEVSYDIGNQKLHMSGCSLSTPIMAGIVATIIHYVDRVAGENPLTASLGRGLRTREGILQVLSLITDDGFDSRRYVAPWKFFERSAHERIALVTHALAELQRRI